MSQDSQGNKVYGRMVQDDSPAARDAAAWFERARQESDARDFDAAVDAYLKGLRLAPEAVDAHIELRLVALRRRQSGGVLPSEEEVSRLKQGKTALDVMLGAEVLLSKHPEHLPYAEMLLRAAVVGGFKRTATWMADLMFLANNRSQRPALRLYHLLKDAYAAVGAWDRAVSACQRALKLSPKDRALARQLRDLSNKYDLALQQTGLPGTDLDLELASHVDPADSLAITEDLVAVGPRAESQGAEDTSLAAAQLFFAKAADAAGSDNIDYAIGLYLDGLRKAPEALEEGHLPLIKLGLHRQARGGKKPSMIERTRLLRGKTPLEQMLNAEFLFAKDPSHLPYAEAMLKAAVAGGFKKTAGWVANMVFQTNNAVERPSFQTYLLLKDSYKALGQWDKAVAACQRAVKLKPGSAALAEEFRNLSAELTVSRGHYDTAEDFRTSIKDPKKQALLYSQDRTIRTEDWRQAAVQEARTVYASDPNLEKNIYNLASALADLETEAGENEAITLLEEASRRLQDNSYRHRAGQIRIKQITRLGQAARQTLEANPKDPKAQAAVSQLTRRLHDVELEHYRQAVLYYPTDLKLKYEYAVRLLKDRRFDEAIPLFQEAQRDPARRIPSMNQVGTCFLAKGWFNDALDVFTAALNELEVKDDALGKEIRYNLARTHEEMGQKDKAVEILRKIAQLDFAYKDVSSRINKLRGG